MECRYETGFNWYKGSLHLHTNRSDGHLTTSELIRVYADENFDFIAVTDHWRLPETNGKRNRLPLLVIDGVELDGTDIWGSYYHVIVIGADVDLPIEDKDFTRALDTAKKNGAILIWAHPHWTGNTVEEGMRHAFHGLEIYNHSSHCENGSGYALSHWDRILTQRSDFFGFATDDSHFVPGQHFWKGGWIMVNAPKCEKGDILDAIRRGNFYSTQGPQFFSIDLVGNTLTITTSPVVYCRLIGPRREGECRNAVEGTPIIGARFEIPSNWPQARIEIEDVTGRRAWTNPLLMTKANHMALDERPAVAWANSFRSHPEHDFICHRQRG